MSSRPTFWLAIPVFRGGDFFVECLGSVSAHVQKFDGILISLNGPEDSIREDLAVALDFASLNARRIEIIRTGEFLSAQTHNKFIMDSLRDRGIRGDDLVMNLFHDDVLMDDFERPELFSDRVIVGDWLELRSNLKHQALSEPAVLVSNWLARWRFHGAWTNGSGMVASWQVWSDVARKMEAWKTGVRYEFLALTHSSVSTLEKSKRPLVRIRLHPGQAGRNQRISQWLRGELMFMHWIVEQGRAREIRVVLGIAFLTLALLKRVASHSLSMVRAGRG